MSNDDRAGHGLAGRLLRLPHVVPRHGRAADRAGRPKVDLVYSPLVDVKEFPEDVDVDAGRGRGRQRGGPGQDPAWSASARKVLVSLGRLRRDRQRARRCATRSAPEASCDRAYLENADGCKPADPDRGHPAAAAERVGPVHEVVQVDVFLPGCPPPADAIYYVLTELLGRAACPSLARRLTAVRSVADGQTTMARARSPSIP